MQQLLSSLFLKTQGSTTFSCVELPYSNLFSDSSLDYRSLSISPTSVSFPTITVSSPSHSLPIKCSHPILVSSSSSIKSSITVSSVVSTIKDNTETRSITFSDINQPQLKPYSPNSYTYLKLFNYDGTNIINFPNTPVTVTCGIDSTNTPVKYTLPNFSTGCQPSTSFIDTTKSVSSIAWGLILASATDSQSLVISTLNGLINSFVDNGSLNLTERGATINSNITPLSDSIYDNSLLGFSVCLSLQYLSSKSNLYLAVDNFYKNCLEVARLLAFISIQYSDPSTNFLYASVSSTTESSSSTNLSFSTSCITSLFFNSFLTIHYDSTIFYKAAKLHLSLLDLPLLPDTLHYYIFSDSSILDIIAHKLWWLCEYDRPRAPLLLASYNETRSSTSIYSDLDFLVASLTNLYLFNNRPDWVYNLFQTYNLDSHFKSISILSINKLTPIVCYSFNFKLISNYLFDTGAISARAYIAYAKNLFILSLPQGDSWSSPTNAENPYTIIGALTHAYTSSLFNVFIQAYLLKKPIFSSSSYILRRLAKIILPPSIYLSEPTIQSYISILLDNSLSPTEKINNLFKCNLTRFFDSVPNYKILLDKQAKTYSTEVTPYNHEFLKGQEYQSIVFFPKSSDITTQQTIGSTFLASRAIPGLPYDSPKTSPAPGTSLSSNESNIHILPLTNLTGLVNLTDNIPSPNNLYQITNLVTPAGVLYKYFFHYFNTITSKQVITSYSCTVSIGAKISIGSNTIIV